MRNDELQRQLAVVARALWSLCRALGRLAWLLLLRLGDLVDDARALGWRESLRRGAVWLLRASSFVVASALVFTLLSALAASVVASAWLRALAGIVAVLALPLTARRFVAFPALGTVCHALVLGVVLLGFGRGVGPALRRHGDWFLPRREAGAPAWLRARIVASGIVLEGFSPPAEMRTHDVPGAPFYGPWRPGERAAAPEPIRARWVHPLADRALPAFESRRFGAARPAPRPPECELGHCGVDLAAPAGTPVFAAADGIVEHVERDAVAGGRSGRYVRLAHLDGAVVTRYLHLDTISNDLRPGQRVGAGALLGHVGRSGVDENFPHLHFALSRRRPGGGAELYLDPEPFLRAWD